MTQDNRNLQRHLGGGPAAIPSPALLLRVRRTCREQRRTARAKLALCAGASRADRARGRASKRGCPRARDSSVIAQQRPGRGRGSFALCGIHVAGKTPGLCPLLPATNAPLVGLAASRLRSTLPLAEPTSQFSLGCGVGCRAASPGRTAAICVAAEFPRTSFPSGLRDFARARTCADGFTILAGMNYGSAGSRDPDGTGCRECGSGHSPHRAGNWSVPTTGSARRR